VFISCHCSWCNILSCLRRHVVLGMFQCCLSSHTLINQMHTTFSNQLSQDNISIKQTPIVSKYCRVFVCLPYAISCDVCLNDVYGLLNQYWCLAKWCLSNWCLPNWCLPNWWLPNWCQPNWCLPNWCLPKWCLPNWCLPNWCLSA